MNSATPPVRKALIVAPGQGRVYSMGRMRAERWAINQGCTEFGSDSDLDNDVSQPLTCAQGSRRQDASAPTVRNLAQMIKTALSTRPDRQRAI
jgi:hypothetical protein